ncbi:Sulfate_transp domain-containing protein/STAS domain-containing protein/Sulfate_tra_GLY domain-containing protein [Cephalotus follicularis]|uniref:Sulfate_transp domain-containing protein/STAS domain-containing protein/Sulfate_tra_GLY domain-containing protein n=1 Tax=Cephalotus follicularis TaxID=3775 RepID=A0A1Q3C9Z1_CEPFO|nr:Sulfate_transp domain-containing protein/STAS domain-containing protein/Sulfate_tra_GLY domain-containing protein [Cephalotus follicularis]
MPTRPVKIIPLLHPDDTTTTSSSSSSGALLSANAHFSKWISRIRKMTLVQWIETFLPCYRWIRTYKWREYFRVDLVAGITVGIMLVPQAMSYAKLAGLEPIYGLYSGFVPIFVYAIFGSSRQLAIGPVALVSLLVSNVLSEIVDSSDALYTELAILLALMVGILECIMGFLRLGWLIRFISHSVISGFTTASAIVIALSQAKYFLGYDIVRSSKIVPLIKSIISGIDEFSWPPFVMGSIILAILLVTRHLGKSSKHLRFLQAAGPLTAVILGTAIAKIFHPSSISLVGEIPQGLPKFSIPKEFSYAKSLIPTALLITGVAILESVGIAKALAAKNGYELDSNGELFGLGVANVFGSFFQAYPTTGSFSRSAVNHETGAKTGLSGIISGIIMGCALLFLTPLFEYIPQCALAAIVISAVIGLVDYDEAIFLWRVDKKDFLLWTITSTTTLFLGIEIGVLVGVGVSLAFVIHESANPHIAVLGRLPGTTVYRNVQQYPEAYTYHGIVVVRIDSPIYFANISYIKDRLRKYELDVDKSTRHGPEVERIYFLIIEMAPVTYIDSSAVQALKDLHQEYKSQDIQIAIANPNREVLLTLSRAGVVELIGKDWYFVRVHDAVQVCLQHVQSLSEGHRASDTLIEDTWTSFQRLSSQGGEDSSIVELESGNKQPFDSQATDPNMEPLLSRKTS